MYMLRFLLTRYARPAYKVLAALAAMGALVLAGAWHTPYFGLAMLVLGILGATLGAAAVTLAVLVLNAVLAAGLSRRLEHFVAAYDVYRRTHGISDPFYEEMDLAEAAESGAA